MSAEQEPVRAAGGVVVRPDASGRTQIAVVHRPRYDDWSLPKGKAHAGESFEEAAVREVREETGLDVELGAPLPEIAYTDRQGRPKRVRYWVMRATGGAFVPNHEVDQMRWLGPDEATALLSYAHDRLLVERPEVAG